MTVEFGRDFGSFGTVYVFRPVFPDIWQVTEQGQR
jgi:hypothetical protein